MNTALFHGDLVESRRIIYTPSDFAKTSLLHLQEIGSLQAQKPHISRRENLISYLFFIVSSGTGALVYNGQRHVLASGDCVFIDCSRSYSHETSDDLWGLKWIHFYGSNLNSIYAKYLERGGQPCFHPGNLHGFDQLWNDLYQIASSSDYIRDMRIYEKLSSLLTLLMEKSWHKNSSQVSSTKQNLIAVQEYLDENYSKKITLEELADKFFINKFYLTRVFKQQFGLSVNNYLLQIRITHAKYLLRFTLQSVESIGLECGMGELYYFSRTLKKVEGISPSEYRRMW